MASQCVVIGVPVNLEAGEYEKASGDTVKTLKFQLKHPGTAAGWPALCEADRADVIEDIERAFQSGLVVEIVVDLWPVRRDRDNKPADWVKLRPRLVITNTRPAVVAAL